MHRALFIVAGGLLVLTGCGSSAVSGLNQAATASATVTPSAPGKAKLAGSVYGGQQPIAGAHVYLFAANTASTLDPGHPAVPTTNGYTSTSLLNASNTGAQDSVGAYVTTGSDGSFSLSGDYSCTPGTEVYVYTLGGDPGGGTNSAAGLLAALGTCPSGGNFATATPFVAVNEVSTVAAAYAIADFATDATDMWNAGTTLAETGIANAFGNAANLADLGSGAALATTPGGATAPQQEVNTLANILAACVNSTGPGSSYCSALFSNAKSSSGATPTDTATAAINIAQNPTANIDALYRVPSPPVAFAPALSSEPTDFTIPLVATPTPPTYFRNALNNETVFMGDSITQYWNLPVHNAGIAGQYTSDMLSRFSTDVLGHGYKRVVILGGTNDIWLSMNPDIPAAVSNVESMATMATNAGMEVVLCTLPANLTAPSFYAPLYGPFNQSLTDYANANGYPIVDYYSLTLGHPEYYITNDNVHPSAAGYAVMEAALSAVVTQ